MRKYFFILLTLIYVFDLKAQTNLRGKISDASSGEPLIGATIIYGKGMGTATDYDGNYSFSIPPGERKIEVSYVGYKAISKIILVTGKIQIQDFKLKTTCGTTEQTIILEIRMFLFWKLIKAFSQT